MSSSIQIKRGTRSQIDSLAIQRGLLPGEPLLITDENRLAIATSTTTYESMAKLSEAGGGGGTTIIETSWSKLFLTMGA